MVLLLVVVLVVLFHLLRVFHANFNESFRGVWVTSLLISPKLFWIFKPILTMLGFILYWFFFWPLILPVSFPNIWWTFQTFQQQLISPSPSCSTAFSAPKQNPSICLAFGFLSFLIRGSMTSSFYFIQINGKSDLLTGNPFVCQNSR